jgi:hypothetical protein
VRLGTLDHLDVPHAEADPRVVERERQLGPRVAPERALHRDDPIARVPASAGSGGARRGDGEAAHVRREAQPATDVAWSREAATRVAVLVEHAPEPQIGDPGAPDLAEPRERRAVAAHAQERVRPAPGALQGGAVVGRGDAHERPQLPAPGVALHLGDVRGAPRHEPAHAVPDECELVERPRPRGDEALEQRRAGPSVGGDVQPGVVQEVDAREPELARDR